MSKDEIARWYARRHLSTDPGIRAVYYWLPARQTGKYVFLRSTN